MCESYNVNNNVSNKILMIEPFYGGSHRQLMDLLKKEIENCELFTLSAKKWHWRARTSAVYFAQIIPKNVTDFRVLFCSSVLNLAELIALRLDLARLKKIIYFHENQLVYPIRKQQERDFQYGYNQIISCLVADVIVFNSHFNMGSFLMAIHPFLKLIPDHRPKDVEKQIRSKCIVLYFPLQIIKVKEPDIKTEVLEEAFTTDCYKMVYRNQISPMDFELGFNSEETESQIMASYGQNYFHINNFLEETLKKSLHIVWPHRWEHDKDPETFFSVLFKLAEEGLDFKLSVLGESFSEVPNIFEEAKEKLCNRILHWGFLPDKQLYYRVLQEADVAISTAQHEFFGIAMLEAAFFKCYPLCPNRLVYPEIFPELYLYNTTNQLYKNLKRFCKSPHLVRNHILQVDLNRFMWMTLANDYRCLLGARIQSTAMIMPK